MGRGECSAVEDYARRGACPPLGRSRGVAEPTVPIPCTKPQLPLFIPRYENQCSAVEDFARRGARPPLGPEEGRGRIRRAMSPYQTKTPAFHTFMCRPQPASAIGTTACPGPRSGIGSRHSSRHSSESWNPEGVGRGECSAVEDYARRGARPPLGPEEGRGRIRRAMSLYQTKTPAFHTFMCRPQPASAIAMESCPGLRSWMRLSHFRVRPQTPPIVIPAIESMPRTPIRGRESTH